MKKIMIFFVCVTLLFSTVGFTTAVNNMNIFDAGDSEHREFRGVVADSYDARKTSKTNIDYEYFEVIEIANFGQTAWGLTTADFNEDGRLDFAVSYATCPFEYSTISIFYQGDDLVFTQQDVYLFNYSYISDLDSGDYDNDGDIDFIFSYSISEGSGKKREVISMLFNDGDNNFGSETIIAEVGSGLETQKERRINPQLSSADFNGDGTLDIIVGDNSGKVELLFNDGSGVFSSAGIVYDFGSISWGLTSADFNGDGYIDFIVTATDRDTFEGNLYLKKNNGLSSCFDADAGEILIDTHGNSGNLITLDYNSDGDLDILAGFMNPYLYNNHNRVYERFLVWSLPNSPDGYGDDLREGALTPGDFNLDGKMDFVAGGVQGVVRLLLNNYQQFPPASPVIDCETHRVDMDVAYNYTFTVSDINEDEVYLYVDWDDGTSLEWIGPYDSGETIILSHTWHEKKTFDIRAKAKDSTGAESDWSTLRVSLQKNKINNYDVEVKIFTGVIGRNVERNIGFDICIWTLNNKEEPIKVEFTFSEVTPRWWEHVTFNYTAPVGEKIVTFGPGLVNGFFQMQVTVDGITVERRGMILCGLVILRPIIDLPELEENAL